MRSTAADLRAGRSARPPVFVAGAADLAGEHFTLRGREGKHASTVRRLAPGERVDVTDGSGAVAECVVAAARPGELELTVLTRRTVARSAPQVTVLQAIPKGDRGELAVELLTEVGADIIVPWAAERSVAVWRGDRAARSEARWRSAAEEAAKQSRRAWFPEITEQADLAAATGHVAGASQAIVLDPDAAEPLSAIALPTEGDIVLVVGPEGGISPAEADAFLRAGAKPARLGPTVLRASTAGVVAAGIVLCQTSRWAEASAR
jgi:16S rRNA (uracil1498-N3)-methyltransferase